MDTYDKGTQSRKWQLTINNPQNCGLDHERIVELLQKSNPDYFCMVDEIAGTGTYHTHVFIYSQAPIRFGTLKARFPVAHIEKAVGTAEENRTYFRKEGKWAETAKAGTSVEGTFFEYGTPPSSAEEKAPKMYQLVQDVKDGYSNTEIINNNPGFAFRVKDIDLLRETLKAETYFSNNRDIQVYYLYGDTGTGKTSGIYAKHSASDICRITDYNGRNGIRFDAYHGQSVLVFEEFNSQVPIEDMLNYLDRYPLMLPARYSDRVACYTTVYITSNVPLNQQYLSVQEFRPKTWEAFLRRITSVKEFCKDGTIKTKEV